MIRLLNQSDIPVWKEIAQEIEYLFGAMKNESVFENTISIAIESEDAFGIENSNSEIVGIIKIDRELNLIDWLGVKESERGEGYGRLLLRKGIEELNCDEISVRTFAGSVDGGQPARQLYLSEGFCEYVYLGKNPAGQDTVLMKKFKKTI